MSEKAVLVPKTVQTTEKDLLQMKFNTNQESDSGEESLEFEGKPQTVDLKNLMIAKKQSFEEKFGKPVQK